MITRPTRTLLLDVGAISLGAGMGALLRHAVSSSFRLRNARYGGYLGTLTVNIIGSFALGIIASASPVKPRLKLLLGVGLCGGFTTFSSFAVDSIALFERESLSLACGYVTANNFGSIGAAVLGSRLVKSIAKTMK